MRISGKTLLAIATVTVLVAALAVVARRLTVVDDPKDLIVSGRSISQWVVISGVRSSPDWLISQQVRNQFPEAFNEQAVVLLKEGYSPLKPVWEWADLHLPRRMMDRLPTPRFARDPAVLLMEVMRPAAFGGTVRGGPAWQGRLQEVLAVITDRYPPASPCRQLALGILVSPRFQTNGTEAVALLSRSLTNADSTARITGCSVLANGQGLTQIPGWISASRALRPTLLAMSVADADPSVRSTATEAMRRLDRDSDATTKRPFTDQPQDFLRQPPVQSAGSTFDFARPIAAPPLASDPPRSAPGTFDLKPMMLNPRFPE